ncbi:SDR family oxidoreductase [Temperatibacter marinus]|uniref:SDR family oxidoreductase n=1 Tax=Temperatibacter marinus TaxID=1456591 RepID=A0AA52H9U1_9PROT|nr:SDR family oxidoreductase [Temperatibacter marinus]WND03546.1 SDR family oxidoreductase [Temperatibacter marinus]
MPQTAVITGSTKGIGFGLAREFASRGWNVVITGRSDESVNAALGSLEKEDGRVIGQPCNVAENDQLQALWDFAIDAFNTVDIWINNAGLARTQWSILDTPDSEIHTMITTNMLGTIGGSKIAAKGMVSVGYGKIFNMLGGGSDGEYFPGMGIYGTTKRGLNYYSDALAKELKDTGVLVGKIRPGMIVTEAVVREAQEDLERFQKSRKFMNTLVDQVETVSPFLVDQMIGFEKTGAKIAWLNTFKIMGRIVKNMISKRPDQFERFGL